MILSTKQNRSQPRRADLWFPGGGGREWDGHAAQGFWMQTVIFGMDGQRDSTV